ncbi:MAG: PQQ-dependent sugar dehydrogenase, partial [Chloroflexi bacterium]|nr:PQQ-dependent sugar dehydrogenase [Chloroflexota bacterium]
MLPARSLVSILAVTMLVVTGLAGAAAQDATPSAATEPMAPNAGAPLPGQYTFYPSQVAQPGGDLPGDPQIQLVQVTADLAEPVNVAAPHDGSGRIFVLERGGTIRIVNPDGSVLPEPFLDWSDQTMAAFLEQGLLGMAFHPNFAENGIFYINYTDLYRSGDVLTLQMTVSADNPNVADRESAEVISFRAQPYPNHIGGDIEFGPDGCLYIGHGDGGLEGDPLDAGQDLMTHLGKMLRIDVNPALGLAPCGKGTTGGAMDDTAGATATPEQTESDAVTGDEADAAAADRHEPITHTVNTGGPGREMIGEGYAIPRDNPFTTGEEIIDLFGLTEDDFARYHPYAQPEIWAFGLRNPWQFSFDRETGDLWIGDVGQNFWEEIDFEPASSEGGFNYGWKFLQGAHCFPNSLEPECPKVGVLPVAEYAHEPTGGSTVIGGHVYRGDAYPTLEGIYFVSDYVSGRVWGIAPGEDGQWQMEEVLNTGLFVTGSGEDEAGNIYFTSCECGYGQGAPKPRGALWMLVAADQVPEGATLAPPDQQQAEATPAVGEGIGAT